MIEPMAEFSGFMDVERMKTLFQKEMPARLFKHLQITECAIQHPRYKTYLNPASREKSFLALVYHFSGINKLSLTNESRIIYTQAFLASRSHEVYQKACQHYDSVQQNSIFHLPEHGLVAWLFPFDPVLTWLPKLLAPDYIQPYFSRLLLAQDDVTPSVVIRVETDIVNYRPEIRCTCLHRVYRLSKRAHLVFSKTYADNHGREVFRRMVHLFQRARHRPKSFAIAEPLGYEEVYRTVWMEGLHGVTMIEAITKHNNDVLISRLAYALADLHEAEVSGLAIITDDDLLLEITKKAGKLGKTFPHLQGRLQAILEKLVASKTSLPDAPKPMTLLHGDFHIEQLLLLADERIALFDFDELTTGHPLIDVANFCADLYNHNLDTDVVESFIHHLFNAYKNFSAFDLNVKHFNWHLQIQLLTRAYRAYIQQKPDQNQIIEKFLNAVEYIY